MTKLTAIGAFVALTCGAHRAVADDDLGPKTMEAGLFVGGFISNYYHQFYDVMKFPVQGTRPLLEPVDPQFGARYAVFPGRYVGVEGEGTVIAAGLRGSTNTAQIYGLTIQALVQLPGRVTPFVGFGAGLAHVSSDTLGSDTDWPIHLGAGVRFFATPTVALRADVRYLRGPSEQAPYTLNAGYGEFNIGVSWIPGATTARASPVIR